AGARGGGRRRGARADRREAGLDAVGHGVRLRRPRRAAGGGPRRGRRGGGGIRGRAAGTRAGDPARPWNGEGFALRWEPVRNGALAVECRVTVREPDATARELRSAPSTVRG